MADPKYAGLPGIVSLLRLFLVINYTFNITRVKWERHDRGIIRILILRQAFLPVVPLDSVQL